MTTFASQKTYPMDRTLSRLRRQSRKRRVGAKARPVNVVEAGNKALLAEAKEFQKRNPGELVRVQQLHATKGWRTTRL